MPCTLQPAAPRRLLALVRLLLLYGILCLLLLGGGLLVRASLAGGWWYAGHPQATGLPRLGVNVDAATPPGAARAARLRALHDAGFGWARLRLDWGVLEPQPGVFAWAGADAWLADIAAAGLTPLVVLDGSPAWARAAEDQGPAPNPLAPPADPADFARFVEAFAARYGDRVRYYQVWDEPNIAPHWGSRWVEPTAYARLLQAAAAAIRAADPDAVIAAAALAPTADRGHMGMDEVYFLQRLVAAGAAGAFDAVAIQPYGFGHAPTDDRQALAVLNYQRAALLRRALVEMGLGDKALWAVRFGWNRTPNAIWGAVAPEAQAGYTRAALDLAAQQWPWLEALGWALDAPAAGPEDGWWGFSLWERDGTPAEVLTALRAWSSASAPASLPPDSPWSLAALWLGLALAFTLVAWRGVAAARLLPWDAWREGWRRLPTPLQALAWLVLLLVYYFATWPPLIGLCWLLWLLLCLAEPRAGLAVAALLLPFYYQHKELHLVDAVVTVPPASAAALCLLPAVFLAARARRNVFGAVDAVALAFLGISLLAAANVWHWPAYRAGLFDLVLVPLILWFAARILASPPPPGSAHLQAAPISRRRPPPGTAIAAALFAGGVLAALWGLAAWLGGNGVDADGVRRLLGPHFSPNHTALYLVRTFFLGVGLALAARQFRRNGLDGNTRPHAVLRLAEGGVWVACALVLLALALTGSRGALLLGLPGGAVILGLVALQHRPDLPQRLAAHRYARGAALAVLLLGAAVLLLLWNRLLNQQTLSLRLDLWEASLRLWRDHLLLGVGPGGFFWIYPAYLPPGGSVEPNQFHPHNIWFEVATTWGLLGFAWLGLLLWYVVGAVAGTVAVGRASAPRTSTPQGIDWLAMGLAAALLAAAAHAQMDAFFLLPDLAAWNALALALLVNRAPIRRYSAG